MELSSRRNRYLIKNTAIFAIGSFSTKIISFFLIPLYTNALTTGEYGIADLATTVCTVLAPVIVLNVGEGIMRFCLDEGADQTKIMSIGLLVLAGALLLGLAIIPIVGALDQVSSYAVEIYFYTILLSGSQVFLCYLRGRERFVSYVVGNIIHTTLIAGLNIVFLLVLDMGLTGYFLAYIVSSAVVVVYAFIAGNVIEIVRNPSFDLALARQMLTFSVVLIPNNFMWWIINSSDRIFVMALLGAEANGVYAVSYKIPQIVSVVASVFNQAWSYSAIHEEGSADRDQYANGVYRALVAASIVTGIGLMLVMKPLMGVLVESSYYDAWRYTPFLIIGNVFMTTGTYLSTWYNINKNSKGFLFSATCGAVVNVILNVILVPLLGITGSALATCAAMVAVFLYRVWDTRKYIRIKVLDLRQFLAYVALFLSGATIFVDGVLGELLMLVELVVALLMLKQAWFPLVGAVLRVAGAKAARWRR